MKQKRQRGGLGTLILFVLVLLLGWNDLPAPARAQLADLWYNRPLFESTPDIQSYPLWTAMPPPAVPTLTTAPIPTAMMAVIATPAPPTAVPLPPPPPSPTPLQRSILVYLDQNASYTVDPGEAIRQLPIEVSDVGTVMTGDDGRAVFTDPNPGGPITFSITYVGRNNVIDTRQEVVVRLVPLP